MKAAVLQYWAVCQLALQQFVTRMDALAACCQVVATG